MSAELLVFLEALVQGITEFLPISSSGHLLLIWEFAGHPFSPSDELVLDVALHAGSLGAVVLYFRKDVGALVRGGFSMLRLNWTDEALLARNVLIGSLPVIIAGFLFKDLITDNLRTGFVVGLTTIGFGLLLLAADLRRTDRQTIGAGGAFFVGLLQILALIPGTSRSGITMTAARLLGVNRTEAARFSLLLSIPAILGAVTLTGIDLVQSDDARVGWLAFAGAGVAFLTAYTAISLMMRWLESATFLPFVIYRLVLGAALLLFLL